MNRSADYLPDNTIDDAMDRELRNLLSTCFTKPEDYVFKTRRYFQEPYPNHWIVRDGEGVMVAHVGGHEKQIEVDGKPFNIGGVGDVCVHPDHRGQGYVGVMLQSVHDWLASHEFAFSVLFGDGAVYGSSGYTTVDNLCILREGSWVPSKAMVRPLADIPWPLTEVHLIGRDF